MPITGTGAQCRQCEGPLTRLPESPTLTEVSLISIVDIAHARRVGSGQLRKELPHEFLTTASAETVPVPRFAEGDVVTGATNLLGESGNGRSAPGGATSCWLEAPDGTRRHLEAVATVGRAEGNDVRLGSPTVSRFHAMLRSIGGHWVVIDLDSRNGTRVRGERVVAPRILHPNDPIQFGEMPFVFRMGGERSSAPATGLQLALRSHVTDHFHLLFHPDSFAEQQREVVGDRLERTYAVLAELFGAAQESKPISVYLLDQIADPEQPEQLIDHGGYSRPHERLIYATYRPESPGVNLEQNLLEVVGARIAGFERWPQTLKDGVLLFINRRADPEQASDEQWQPLRTAFEQEKVPPLSAIVSRAEQDDAQVSTLAIGNLLEYAASTFTLQAVTTFLTQISQTSLDGASRAAFHKPLKSLEKKWRSRLKSGTLDDIRLFVRLLFPYLRSYKLKIAEIIFYVALSVAFGIVLAKAEGYLVDKALLAGNFHVFELIMGGLLAAFLVTSLASLREGYVKAWVTANLLSRLRLAMFQKVQALDPGYFDHVDSGDLITRLTSDVFMVENALSYGMVETIRFSLMFVVAFIVIFLTDWKLALVTVVGLPLFVLIGRLLGRPVTRASMELQTESAAVTSRIHENLGAQPVVKLFGLERQESEGFASKLDHFVRTSLRMHFLSGLYGFGSNSITSLIQLGVLGAGGYLVLHGHATTGTLFAFMTLVGQIISPMQMLSQFFQMVQTGSGSMKRINELLSTRPAVQDASGAVDIKPLSREIRFEHVTFSYDGSRNILEDINLSIPAGTSMAVVGPSGSGKSSLLNLVTRFYDPKYGQVLFDGVDLRACTVASLRSQIGMVFQESFLFNDTIRENIRMARPGANDQDVEQAARSAELHEFITQLPDGYETLVGERGGHLSGGQRQRVAIARAILRNPPVLLLDEATSALDPATEAAINDTLRHVAAGRTTISVTHRLSSVATADLIVVLDGGRLVEQGTHETLLRTGGLYCQLWEEQQGRIADARLDSSEVDLATLQRVPLFRQLDGNLLARIARSLNVERAETGSAIVTAGEPGDRLYVVKSGEVEVLAAGRDGQPRRLAILGEGDYFGEIALLREVPRTATVRARTPVELYGLSRDAFQGMLAVLPALRETIMETVAEREQGLRLTAVSST